MDGVFSDAAVADGDVGVAGPEAVVSVAGVSVLIGVRRITGIGVEVGVAKSEFNASPELLNRKGIVWILELV